MEHTNRLANEKSPYLLQHKNNPINWYAWGQDAFDEAKRRNVPIFLSVGYSTCHWCHVMEKESFENQKIADILNEHYVSIKVDREERPDVDKLYMAFIQAISGGGGWPMSVFLTPDLSPVTGGTYFPPDDSRGRPGFASILRLIADKWTENPQQILDQGKALMDAIKNNIGSEPGDAPPSKQVCSDAFAYLCKRFDRQRGGFGSAPKFPKPVDLDFLIHCAVHPDSPTEARLAHEMVDRTLDAMDRGGIHDHVGKGFHRYSVDADWHVPHFEKMLYDQAQLLATYSEWHMLTGNYEHVVRDIVDYVDGNLTHPAGGFYSAEDADSLPEPDAPHKREGAFCVWTQTEIEELLKNWKAGEHPLSEVISAYFDIEEDGNVPPSVDPHGELTGQNVLIMRRSHEEYATQFGLNEGELRTAVGEAKAFLASRRALRPKPHLDSKIVTCWQGLMLSGLCRATVSLKDTTILEKALKNFDFIREHLVDSNGDLKRAVYTGENGSVEQTSTPIGAFSDDYAFLIQALLDLHEITFDQKYLEWATDLQKRLDANFWDTEKEGGYFVSSKATSDSPGVRMMEDQDGAEPCGNSVSFCNLIRLYEITDRKAYRDTAEKLLRAAAQRLNRFPYILCKMLAAYARLHEGNTKIVVVGKLDDARTKTFLDYVQGVHVWNKAVVLLDPLLEDSWLEIECPAYKEMRTRCQQPTVFVCQGFTCGLPITSGEELKNRLDELVSHVSPQAKKEEDSSCKRK